MVVFVFLILVIWILGLVEIAAVLGFVLYEVGLVLYFVLHVLTLCVWFGLLWLWLVVMLVWVGIVLLVLWFWFLCFIRFDSLFCSFNFGGCCLRMLLVTLGVLYLWFGFDFNFCFGVVVCFGYFDSIDLRYVVLLFVNVVVL